MAYVEEAERYLGKIDSILEWAGESHNGYFNTEFVDNVKEQVEQYGSISEGQKTAIDNIIDRWHI